MKIAAIRATPVNIPLEAPYLWAFGELPGFTRTIVEVETDDGIVGVGDVNGAGAAATIVELFAPVLIGRDAVDINGAEAVCVPWWKGVQSINDFATIAAFGAVETALWDIRGKAWNQPVHALLGGAVRTEIPFTDYFSFRADGPGVRGERTAEEVADYCVRLREEHGTTNFEGKLSTRDPRHGLRAVQLIRERLGEDVLIRVDSNAAYSLATALRMAPELEALGVRGWEDPVATFEEMARLRRHCSIPISTHNIDLARAVAIGAPDALVTSPSIVGGIGRFARLAAACEEMSVDLWCYSGDSGIGTATYLHVCAAIGWIREPNQSLLRMQPIDVIAEGPFRPRNNVVPVPTGPGLGVTLDPDKLAFAHRLFVDDGPLDKYHQPHRPGEYRRLPLC
ncbi:MAG TPA: mandelate racemase/muconate lactonizing enzyme family protein [Ilumatobacteraceae bacterium]